MVSVYNILYPSIYGSLSNVQPTSQLSLSYQSVTSNPIEALVQADLQLPSILLENIPDVSDVSCSLDNVTVTFNSTPAYEASYAAWHPDMLLVTNHLGDCDAEAERGIYQVSSLVFDNDTLTVLATTRQTTLQDQARNVRIDFGSSPAPDASASVNLHWSGDLISTAGLRVHADEVSVDALVDLAGVIEYNLETHTASALQLDISLGLDAAMTLSASAEGPYSANLYTYKWSPIPVSPFSIPGVLSVGPLLDLNTGVDFGTSGLANFLGNASVSSSGLLHLDLLDSEGSSATGLQPQATGTASISAKANAQLDPFVGAEVAIGVTLFNNVLDLSCGVQAKGLVANVFNVDTGDTALQGCENGYWFACDFLFNVTGYVTHLYSVDFYHAGLPLYETACIAF